MKLSYLVGEFVKSCWCERRSRRFFQECRDAQGDLLEVTGDIELSELNVELVKKFIQR
jgi:hypothetical protein